MGVVMKKRLHQPTGKHVLLVLRKIIGARAKESKAALGLAPDTVKSITSRKGPGRMPFTEHAAATVAKNTGVAFNCLLDWQPGKPLKTDTGKPFTEETYKRHRMRLESVTLALPASRKRCDEAFRLYYLLCIKLGRAMLAAHEGTPAQPEGDTRFAAWALRDAINKVGNLYPSFDTNRNVRSGLIELRSIPETFDDSLQTLMNSGKKKPVDVWRAILKQFHLGLEVTEATQAAAASKETTSELAKPSRR
jgi:hypothetical protein